MPDLKELDKNALQAIWDKAIAELTTPDSISQLRSRCVISVNMGPVIHEDISRAYTLKEPPLVPNPYDTYFAGLAVEIDETTLLVDITFPYIDRAENIDRAQNTALIDAQDAMAIQLVTVDHAAALLAQLQQADSSSFGQITDVILKACLPTTKNTIKANALAR